MARLIDATRIEQYILNNCSDNEEINAIYGEIINAPTIEAEPKHGRWLKNGDRYCECSVCHHEGNISGQDNYCWYCGARMDGEENG